MLTRQNENHVDHTALTDGWFTNGTAAVKNALVSWNEQQLPLPFRVSLCLPLCDLEPDGTSSCCQAAADVGCGTPWITFSWEFTKTQSDQPSLVTSPRIWVQLEIYWTTWRPNTDV